MQTFIKQHINVTHDHAMGQPMKGEGKKGAEKPTN